jgi:chromosomal replication initiation ATPase DnaA
MTQHHWTEAAIATALKGRFYLIDGTDKHAVDANLEAQRHADKIRERQELEAMTRIEQLVQASSDLLPEAIITAVAHAHRVGVLDIKSTARLKHLVHARQHACALLRELTDLSYPAIGRAMGGQDHTTVLHGVQRWAQRGHVYAEQDRAARQMLGVRT